MTERAAALASGLVCASLTLAACGEGGSLNHPSKENVRADRIATASRNWPTTPNYHVNFSALEPQSASIDRTHAFAFDADDEFWGLPRAEGVELVAIHCASCHTVEIVMQQRASRTRWDYMLDWMVQEQGMPPLLSDERGAVLDYLASAFGSDAP